MIIDGEIFQAERQRMVKYQVEQRGIYDQRLLSAMRELPRHCFVPDDFQEEAYQDHPLPIGEGQTISQPYIVALMTQVLKLQGTEIVLEVGTGSGYQAALLGKLAAGVHTIEVHAPLAERARLALAKVGINNVWVHQGDGSLGWPPDAPYDAVVVTAAAPRVPPPLLEQLAEGGRLVIPVGPRYNQELQLWTRVKDVFTCESVLGVVFVPLRGAFGWSQQEWGA